MIGEKICKILSVPNIAIPFLISIFHPNNVSTFPSYPWTNTATRGCR